MAIGVIYKIVSPSNKVYIGQTVSKVKRFSKYKKGCCGNQTRLNNSFLKYGFKNHKIEIIEECDIEILNERERYWQDYYDVLGVNGLNCKLTKSSDKSSVVSDETKLKLSNHFKQNPISYWKNKELLFCGKYKMRLAKLGKKQNEKHIKLAKENRKINSSILILDTELGIFYNSITDVSNTYNINYNNIRRKLSGLRKNNTKFIKV